MKKLIIASLLIMGAVTAFAHNGENVNRKFTTETAVVQDSNPHDEVLRKYHLVIYAQGYNSQFGEPYIIILYDETDCMTMLDIKYKIRQYQQSRPNETITFTATVAGSCSIPL